MTPAQAGRRICNSPCESHVAHVWFYRMEALSKSFAVFRQILSETMSVTSAAEAAVAAAGGAPNLQAWLQDCFSLLFENMSTGQNKLPATPPPQGLSHLAGAILVHPYPPSAQVERSLDAVEALARTPRAPVGRAFSAGLGLGLGHEMPIFLVLETMAMDASEELSKLVDGATTAINSGSTMATALQSLGVDVALVSAVKRGEESGALAQELLAYAGLEDAPGGACSH